MLGHNKRLERKLKERGGERAWAIVLESKEGWTSSGGANVSPGQAGSFTVHQKLRLRVEPDGEQPFESTVKQAFDSSYGWEVPKEGYSVGVIYDPDDHSKLGVLIYLIARGNKMHEHAAQAAQQQDAMFRQYIRSAAASPADDIAKLDDLRSRGIISDEEFERAKQKAMG